MLIIADDNIPYADRLFRTLGDLRTVPGGEITPELARDADILLTRSTIQVNEELLGGSRARFVATATIGTDHVDQDYLARRGIEFTNAAGSNANSVAEYIAEGLLVLAERFGWNLSERSIGVIGVGNVGSRVVEKARALGMRVVQHDPPLARQTRDGRYRPLEEALQCDVVTLHVPLTREGPDATHGMADRRFFERMPAGSWFFNSSRGLVVAEEGLKAAIDSGHLSAVLLDVWAGEPDIDAELLRMVEIATAHIAGHSLDGKAAGTQMVYEAACRHLGVEPTEDVRRYLPEPDTPHLTVEGEGGFQEILWRTARQVYDIRRDDAKLRAMPESPAGKRASYFVSLRRNYGPRREFYNTTLELSGCADRVREALLGLGFLELDQER